MQPSDLQDLIAVARITGALPGRPGRFSVTVGGDGRATLKTPVDVWLHRPAYRGTDLKKILASITPHPQSDGRFERARLVSRTIGGKKSKAQVRLDVAEETQRDKGDEELYGWWVCVERRQLIEATSDVFIFQLIGLAVYPVDESGERGAEPIAVVTGYMETGAHGLLETRTLPRGDAEVEVLVPLVPEYAELDLPNGRVYVRGYEDLIP